MTSNSKDVDDTVDFEEVSFDDLADQFAIDCRNGLAKPVDDYAEAYPQLADQIRDLFPSIEAIEQLGSDVSKTQRNEQAQAAIAFNRIEQIGDYKIVGLIGRGGMGIVYDAVQQSLDRPVAVKLLLQHSSDAKHLKRFEREARTAANLHHTNIVPVFGVGSHDGYHYYVMQRIDGVGLDEVLSRLKDPDFSFDPQRCEIVDQVIDAIRDGVFLPPDEQGNEANYFRSATWIATQVASALQYAHDQGTLHRDIKPANVLLDREGGVWLTDFGLAKAMETDDVTRTGDVVGTLRYMAPEQFAGTPSIHSDTYSLGLTLYEILTLTPAHDDLNRSHLIGSAKKSYRIKVPTAHDATIPRDLETIAMKACRNEISERYASAGELAADLENFLLDRPIVARPANSVERFAKWCRRNPAVASLSFLAASLLALVAITTSIGYFNTNAALVRESKQRMQTEAEKAKADVALQKAETTLGISLDALDRVYQRFAPDRMIEPEGVLIEGVDGEEITVAAPLTLSDETASLLEDVLGFYDQFALQDSDNVRLKFQAAKANRRVGDIQKQLGAYEKSESAYLNAARRYRSLSGKTLSDEDAVTLELARIQNDLGDVYLASDRHQKANSAHREALKLLEPFLDSQSADIELKFELARTWYLLDRRNPPERGAGPPPNGPPRNRPPKLKFGNLLGGNRFYFLDKSIALLRSLDQSESGHPEHRFLLALCFRERVRRGRQSDTQPAIDILETLARQHPHVPDYRFELGETYARINPHHMRDSQRENAAQRLEKSIGFSRPLTSEHPNIPRYAQSLSRSLHKLANVRITQQRFDDAIKLLQESAQIQVDLATKFSQFHERLSLSQIRDSLAIALTESGQHAAAREVIDESIEDLEKMLEESKYSVPATHSLIRQHRTLARIHEASGDGKAAQAAINTANRYRQQLPRPRLFGL